MAKSGVTWNYAAIGELLKSDPVAAGLEPFADGVAADSGGTVTRSVTDRVHFEVSVPAHEQAINGKLTKALGRRAK